MFTTKKNKANSKNVLNPKNWTFFGLSKDDNKSRYSSIDAQMELAKEYADSQGWNLNIIMIKRILKDEIYIGTVITHKTKRKDIHKQGKKIERGKQYIFENHHEAIISKEQFERVQQMIKKSL